MSSILLLPSRKYPSISSVGADVQSHTKALESIVAAIQTHERRDSDKLASFVRVQDLIDLGLCRLIGKNRLELLVSGGGGGALDDLSDVEISTPSNGQILVYNGSEWVNSSTGGGTVDSVVAGTSIAVDSADPANPIVSIDTTKDRLYANNVELLLGFNGANNATSTSDEGPLGRTLTFNGNAKLSTSQFKFGTASLQLDGTGDYLTVSSSGIGLHANQNFTIEAWVRLDINNKTQAIANKRPSSGAEEWGLGVDSTGHATFQGFNGGSSVILLTSTTVLSTATWYHVAGVRHAPKWFLFLNGTLEGSGIESNVVTAVSNTLNIGRDALNTARDFQGFIDELRFTSQARYVANFTAPTAAFPRVQRE